MTVHKHYCKTNKTDSKRVKSKIILPQKPLTKLMYKNKKITKSITKIGKISISFYSKNKINTILASLKNQNASENPYKVHSVLKFHITRCRNEQVTSNN